jgi:hypothetical protein
MPEAPGQNRATAQSDGDGSSLRVDLWLFIVMLVLAVVGVAITQVEHAGGKLYWLFLVVVYAGISVVRTWQKANRQGTSGFPMIRAQILHWLGALVAINIVLLFESGDVASRGAAADYSLLILALSCYLAGVHFNWSYSLLGGLLLVMALGLGYLDQLSLYALVIPVAVLAVWVFSKRKGEPAAGS